MSDFTDERGMPIAQPDPMIHDFAVFPIGGNLQAHDHQLFTSLKYREPEEGQIFYDILTTGGETPDKYINLEIEIIHVTAWPIEFVRAENGEVCKTWSVVLGLKGSKQLHFKSAGILRSLGALFYVLGKPPFDPPVKMKLLRKQLKADKSMYMLERVGSWAKREPKTK